MQKKKCLVEPNAYCIQDKVTYLSAGKESWPLSASGTRPSPRAAGARDNGIGRASGKGGLLLA